MIQPSALEQPAVPAPCGLAPYLIETLTHSLCAQLRADFSWACLRLPGEPGVILAIAGRIPASYPLAPAHWDGDALHVAAGCQADIVAIGSLRYEGATLDYLLGREERPLSPLEWRRFDGLFERWQAALDEASLEQRTQALVFQARLAQRREAQCRKLKARLAAQEERQRVVYHDLINDLTPAVFAVETLQERVQGLDELGHLVLIDRQFNRMRRRLRGEIASPLLDGEVGCDLSRVVREGAETWRGAFERRALAFRGHIPQAPLRVAGEEGELSAIVYNLLSNAQKYTPPGGSVEVSLGVAGRNACLVVRDCGAGIAPAMQARLFEPGTRGETNVEGSGVGLTQVASIVRRLLGGISVESALGQGSTFKVLLPLARAENGSS